VVSGTAPLQAGLAAGGLTSTRATGHRRFDLETEVLGSKLARRNVRMWAEIDRLNARIDHRRFRLTVGRQPITWGVNYFWPVLDLFGPFSPAAIDRDYKPGVDAVRLSVPVGDFSEVQVIAAAHGRQGSEPTETGNDWSYGAMSRFHLGAADLGFLLGSFYRDEVAGAFVTGDAGGFGLRGEVLFTHVDANQRVGTSLPSASFWRATFGVDRLLSPRTSLVTEISWNGFGARDPAAYPLIAASDRVQRGEITSLGREYSGVSLSFLASPLWTVSAAMLTNWGDRSTLLQPSLTRSLSDNASATLGAFVGIGRGTESVDRVGSEYGAVPVTAWAALKTFF
jgi:hypothetical protein